MTNTLFNEVDADLRAEKLSQLWRRWQRPVLIGIALLIAFTAANSMWQHHREKRGGERLAQLTEAHTLYESGKPDEAADAFAAIAADSSGEVRTLAELWQGRALAAANRNDEAVAALTSASTGTPGLWSDLACLRLASIDSAAAEPCLSRARETPLLNQRREWLAAGQWATDKQDDAIATFEDLATSSDASEAERARISQWLTTLRAQAEAGKAGE